MPLILHIFLILIATVFALLAAVKRPETGIAFGWFALFWFLFDILITGIVSYGR